MEDNEKREAVALQVEHTSDINNEQLFLERPNFISRQSLRLFIVLLCGFFTSTLNGYDGAVLSGVYIFPSFQNTFGTSNVGKNTAFAFSIFYIGGLVAAFFSAPLLDKFGRRITMGVGSLFAILGGALCAGAHELSQFEAGRFFLGLGTGFAGAGGALYVIELAHPGWRGQLGALFMCFYFTGSITANFITFGCSYIPTTEFSWRFPLAIQILPALIIFFMVWFVPESPRYLLAHGRHADARAVMVKYHAHGDEGSDVVRLELAEMELAIDATGGVDKRWWDYSPLFRSRRMIYRCFLLCNTSFAVQWCGNGIANYYLPTMLAIGGVSNLHIQLLIAACIPIFALIMAMTGAFLVDILGRRRMFMIGFGGVAMAMAVIAGVASPGTANINKQESAATIAFVIVFRLFYATFLTPLETLYGTEILPYATRAKGWSLYNLFTTAALFGSTYATPVALQALGYKFYFVFIAYSVFLVFIVFLVYPETRRRTLEEIDEIFESSNPVKASMIPRKVPHDAISNEGQM